MLLIYSQYQIILFEVQENFDLLEDLGNFLIKQRYFLIKLAIHFQLQFSLKLNQLIDIVFLLLLQILKFLFHDKHTLSLFQPDLELNHDDVLTAHQFAPKHC